MSHTQNLEPLRHEIVDACHKLYERELVANHDGNITYRLSDGLYLATPTSFSKGDVTEKDILTVDSAGKVVDGPHKVFSEFALHLVIYRVRPDIKCIVHAHPPTASGFALAGRELGIPAIPEAIVSLGRHILNIKFISPLDTSLFDSECSRVLRESDAFQVPGNGAWSVGQNILQTYYRMELVEHIAKQHLAALQLGALKPLPLSLVEELVKKRKPTKTNTKQIDVVTLKDIVRLELEELLSRQSKTPM